MERVLRIIGVAIVLALPVWAYRSFDRAVSAEPTGSDVGVETEAETEGDIDGDVEAETSDGVTDDTVDTDGVDPDDGADPAASGDGDGEAESDGGRVGDEITVDGSTVEEDPTGLIDALGEPPDYLAYRHEQPVLATKVYRVVRDDAEERPARSSSRRRTSATTEDYPTETDLTGDFSLATSQAIEPGLYASAMGAESCSYELHRFDADGEQRLIGQERLGDGRVLVTIDSVEPDIFSSVPQCRFWIPWTPLAVPLIRATAGDYWIGDLAEGTWAVPEGCLWEKVVAFRGARLADVVDSARGPAPLIVDEDTMGVRIRDCDRPLVLVEAGLIPGVDMEPGLSP